MRRSELYAAVWERPMCTLAAELGISDGGLSKLCKRHAIPTPGLGYWAKVAAGATPRRKPSLPPGADAVLAIASQRRTAVMPQPLNCGRSPMTRKYQ